MKIESVALSLPSWELDNEEVVDIIRYHSKPVFSGNLEEILRKVMFLLNKTGAENRFWLNRQKKEKPIDHVIKATEEALQRAKMSKNDIDLLIYVGIGKGFAEPANSYMVAQALGMNKARCFDITDACMSWSTALQIADSFFKAGAYKNALVVNAEFTVNAGPLFKNFQLKHPDQLKYTFPSFTIGEAATATVLLPEEPDNFKFCFASRPDLADLCVIATDYHDEYCHMTEKTAKNGAGYFTSFGSEMHESGSIELEKLFNDFIFNKDLIDIVFTHASSKTEWTKCAQEVGIDKKIYHIYQKTGNLVSASLPAGIALAFMDGKLKEKSNIFCWIGSAGMSFAGINFDLNLN